MPRRRKLTTQPIERFPLKPRADGRFQKRINGVLYYFGYGGDRDAALREYDRVKHDLYAGRLPRAAFADADTATVKQLAGRFLDDLLAEAKAGRRTMDWYRQCRNALRRLVKHVGDNRAAADLRPEDFAEYARALSAALGHHAYNRERSSIIAMFRHAVDCDWIDRPVKFGKGFRKVPRATIRDARTFRLVEAATIKRLLSQAKLQMYCTILLAINGGYGGKDCGQLPWDKVDLAAGVIRNYRRHKTGINRDTPLWPETIDALALLRAKRPNDTHVFRTKYGNLWNGVAIAHELKKLVGRINATGGTVDVVLGDLRHTFYTYANETGDTDAGKRIMGHALPGLKETYVETLFIPRLKTVTDHVRSRVLGFAK